MKKLLILCAFFMPFFVSAANTPQVNDFTNSSRIYRRQLSLTAGKQYKFRTFSSGDSVLYLLNSSNVQVAMNDDCGSDCLSTRTAMIRLSHTHLRQQELIILLCVTIIQEESVKRQIFSSSQTEPQEQC